MESVAVQPKSFVLRWAEVPPGSRVTWQLTPQRKSIAFGVCRCVSKPSAENSSSNGDSTKLADKLERSGLQLIEDIGKVHAGETREGELTACGEALDGLYAFVFDNTFSKSTSKTVSFYFFVEPPEPARSETFKEPMSDASTSTGSQWPQSQQVGITSCIEEEPEHTALASTRASGGELQPPQTQQLAVLRDSPAARSAPQLVPIQRKRSNTSTSRLFRRGSAVSITDRAANSAEKTTAVPATAESSVASVALASASLMGAAASSVQTVPNSVTVTDSEEDSSAPVWTADERYLSGVLQKKRRKRHQGFAKRYFVLDLKLGLLSYFLSQKSNSLRGVMPMRICNMVVNERSRDFVLDSSVERWLLRAPTASIFQSWLAAFQGARVSTVGEILSRQVEYPGEQGQQHPERAIKALNSGKVTVRTPQVPFLDGRTVGHGKNPASAGAGVAWTSAAGTVLKLKTALDSFEADTEAHSASSEALASAVKALLRDFDVLFQSHKADVGTVPELVVSGGKYEADNEDEFFDALETLDIDKELDSQRPATADADLTALTDIDAYASADDVWSQDVDDGYSDLSTDEESDVEDDRGQAAEGITSQSQASLVTLSPLPFSEQIQRRTEVPKCKSSPPSLLSVIRKNAGKDLTSITMPITSNEPITALQKIAEIFEYSTILDRAAKCDNPMDRCMLVAVFAVSPLSSMRCKDRANRKPFNPLLGETYELVREDKNFRFLAEKVSHRPPIYATYTESEAWTVQFTSRPHQKVWAKSAEVTDTGIVRLVLKSTGETFEYRVADCFLRNLLAGEKYMEPAGTMHVESSQGPSVTVTFHSGGMFSGRSETLTIKPDPGHNPGEYPLIDGKWTEGLFCNGSQVWAPDALIKSPKEHYGWTVFTASLNEITILEHDKIPVTDSRMRQDQRLYEEQVDIDTAERLKLAYEETQRQRRKAFESSGKSVEPQFFNPRGDAQGVYQPRSGKQNYWNRRKTGDWKDIEEIFVE